MHSLSIIKWFWRISKPFRLQACLNALVSVLAVGLDFAFIAATKMVIDIATGQRQSSLTLAASLLVAVIVGQLVVGFSRKWIGALLGVRSQNKMQHMLFSLLMRSEWTGLEKHHSGDILNRLERDVSDVTNVITETVPSALGVGIRLLGAFFYLYTMDASLACIILVIVPVFAVLSRLYVKKMRKLTREIRQTDSSIQSILTESVQHRMVLKTLERTGTMADRLADTQAKLRAQVRHRTLFSSSSALLLNVGFAAGYLVTFLWGASRLHEGTITYGMMLAFIQLVGQIQGPFREMTRFVPIIVSSFTAGERLIELQDIPLEEEGEPMRFQGAVGIRLTNVTYAYSERKRTILDDFSFDFPPGSTTAILGETGAGKTTLIRLILALLKPQSGRVELYSVDSQDKVMTGDTAVAQVTPDEGKSVVVSPLTRCNLVYVPQGNTLFSGTIRDNLLLGNPDATDADMEWALRCACADFVLQRPEGLDAMCGEMGQGMSEGQAQRISIARALLRKGNVLLLDEATSALDMQTEQQLLSNLSTMLDGRQTVLFITHRPAVVQHCSQTLKMERHR